MTQTDTEPDTTRIDYLAAFRLLTRHGAAARGPLILSTTLATLSVAAELVPVWAAWTLVAALIDGTAEAGLFLRMALLSAVAVVFGFAAMGLALAQSHLAAFRLIHALRLALAHHLATLPLGWFSGRRSGEAKKLVVDEPERMELIVAHAIPEGTSALVTWVSVTVWLFVVDWRLALASILLTPVSFLLMQMAMRRAGALMPRYSASQARMNGSIVEYLAGMPVVKIFNRADESFAETAAAVTDHAALLTRMARLYVPLGGPFYTLVLANVCVILPVGLWLLNTGRIELTTLVFFLILGANYSQPLIKLFNQFHTMAHVSMGAMAVLEALGTDPQPDSGQTLPLGPRDVIFDGVSFSYGTREVLHDVSFTASAGAVTALVGPSGAGKSTVAGLIPRFHDVDKGRVTLGGQDVRDIGQEQLMDEIGFVFQQTFLFSGTIGANIRFGKPDATLAELHAAARAARAHDFIMALPQGYDTPLGEGGARLSGGERQRIAIARAILKDAPVIVLDEATAFADPDSEAAIQEALSELARGKTLIVVAHRLHTIANADRIVVLDHGRVSETGPHDDLIAARGLYARLWADYTSARDITLHRNDPDAPQLHLHAEGAAT